MLTKRLVPLQTWSLDRKSTAFCALPLLPARWLRVSPFVFVGLNCVVRVLVLIDREETNCDAIPLHC